MRRTLLTLAALLPTVTAWAQSGPALPSTCTAGEVFTFTGATPNLKVICVATTPPFWVVSPFGVPGGTTTWLRADGTWTAPTAAAAWGGITGTLANQTDLQTALDGLSGLADGDKGDVTVSAAGLVWTIDAGAVTKAEVGLGNVDNTTDAGKPVSTATQTALDAKAATAHSHLDAEVANTITLDNLTQVTTRAIADTTGTLAVARGGTNLTAAADDNVLVGNATTWETKALPDCDTAATSKLLYDTTTNAFSCGTDQAAGGGPTTLISTGAPTDAVVATYTAIPGIAFTPAANTKYLIDCVIIYTTAAATTGISFAWDVPTAATIHMSGYTTTTAAGLNEGFWQRADNVGGFTSAGVITVQNTAILAARLENGANATSTTLGFTPEIATSSAVIAGSVCQYRSY
jgi:hypothetical protein